MNMPIVIPEIAVEAATELTVTSVSLVTVEQERHEDLITPQPLVIPQAIKPESKPCRRFYPSKRHADKVLEGFFLSRECGAHRMGQMLVMTRKRNASHMKLIKMFLPPAPGSSSVEAKGRETRRIFFDRYKLRPGLVFNILEIVISDSGTPSFLLKKLNGVHIHPLFPFNNETCPLKMTEAQAIKVKEFTGVDIKFEYGRGTVVHGLYMDEPKPESVLQPIRPIQQPQKKSESHGHRQSIMDTVSAALELLGRTLFPQ